MHGIRPCKLRNQSRDNPRSGSLSVYTKVLKHMEYMKQKDPEKNVVKGGWSKEEDDKLLELVHLMVCLAM